MEVSYVYNAIVKSVYDADTIRVDIDLGCNVWLRNEPIRFMGINAPEIRGEERDLGIASRDWLLTKLQPNDKIIIQTVKDKKGKYGRYLAWVYVDGININQLMIQEGYAKEANYE